MALGGRQILGEEARVALDTLDMSAGFRVAALCELGHNEDRDISRLK